MGTQLNLNSLKERKKERKEKKIINIYKSAYPRSFVLSAHKNETNMATAYTLLLLLDLT